jgi:hypothetical protein
MHSIHVPATRTALRLQWALASILTLVGCAAAHAAIPVVDTNVVNTPKVIDAENPARSAFGAQFCRGSCGTVQDPAMTVPGGKVAVIEFVSASCSGGTTDTLTSIELFSSVKGSGVVHHVPLQSTGSTDTVRVYGASQIMRVYADPSTDGLINVSFAYVGTPTPHRCNISISGHLLNQ